MNWKKIWSGSLLAGLVVAGVNFGVNTFILGSTWQAMRQAGLLKTTPPLAFAAMAGVDLGTGFLLMWLYALVRSRLGPGPSTALLMGTAAWFLLWVPRALTLWLWQPLPAHVPLILLATGLLQCWAGMYVAGWQYIEKAPS